MFVAPGRIQPASATLALDPSLRPLRVAVRQTDARPRARRDPTVTFPRTQCSRAAPASALCYATKRSDSSRDGKISLLRHWRPVHGDYLPGCSRHGAESVTASLLLHDFLRCPVATDCRDRVEYIAPYRPAQSIEHPIVELAGEIENQDPPPTLGLLCCRKYG